MCVVIQHDASGSFRAFAWLSVRENRVIDTNPGIQPAEGEKEALLL